MMSGWHVGGVEGVEIKKKKKKKKRNPGKSSGHLTLAVLVAKDPTAAGNNV